MLEKFLIFLSVLLFRGPKIIKTGKNASYVIRLHYLVIITGCLAQQLRCFSGDDSFNRNDILRNDRRHFHLQLHVGRHHVVQAHYHLALVPV
jgi:hypothetical protein